MLNKNIFTIVFAIASLQLSAQKPSNEFQIYGGAGIPLSFPKGTSAKGFGVDLGIGFTAFVSQQIGIHFGVDYGLNNVEINVDNLKTVTLGLRDDNGYLFDKHTTLSNYNESQKTTFFSVPIMLQFQPNTQGFYAMSGAKLLFQYKTTYESNVAILNNVGYYPEFDNWATTQLFAGFGTFDGNNTDGNFDIGLSTILALEIGMKWQIGRNMFLYTGAFVDYSLSDPLKEHRKPVSDFTTPESLQNLTLLQYADNVNSVFVGLKLRLAFIRSSTLKMRQIPRGRQGMIQGYCPAFNDRSKNTNVIFNRP